MRYDPLARKLPFIGYLVALVFLGGGTLSEIGAPSNGGGFVVLMLDGIAALLAYFGWKNPKERTG
jgi:hypothetical protein